jgi:hypothetical protein
MGQIVQARPCWAAMTAISTALLASAGDLQAAVSRGCASANHGGLDMEVGPGRSVEREAYLAAGETLSFSVTTRSPATVALVSGNGAPRALYSGSRAASMSFSAPAESAYGFRLTAGNDGPAAISVRCAMSADARREFLTRTTDLLLSKAPDRMRIDRPETPITAPSQGQSTQAQANEAGADDPAKPRPAAVSVSLSEIAAAANPGARREPSILDFWFEGRYEPYETVAGANNGELSAVYVGSNYKLGPDIMIGALAQFDRADELPAGGAADVAANGWMFGPYMSVRFGPGIILDGRAAWGSSESGIAGVSVDKETSDRRLLYGKLRGDRKVGSWTFAPSVALTYFEERTAALAASEAQAELPAAQGRLEVLPELKRRFEVNGDTYVEPRASVGGFLSFDDLSRINPAAAPDQGSDLHLKAEAGVAVGVKDGMNIEAKGGLESTKEAEPENWTGRLQLNMPLGK